MSIDQIEGLARSLFAESGDALFLFDPDDEKILLVSAVAAQLTGVPAEQLIEKPVMHWFQVPEDLGPRPLRRASASTHKFHSKEGYFLRTSDDGVWIPVNLSLSRLHVKPKTLALITARDVREQRNAYKKLERTEAELRRVLNSVSDCLWSARVVDRQWSYQYVSPVVQRITGKPPDFFQPGLKQWQKLVHPEDVPRWKKMIQRLLDGQSANEEYRLQLEGGGSPWVRESVQARRSGKGTIHLHGIVTDITQRKSDEAEIRRINSFLDSIVENAPIMLFVKEAEQLRFELVNRTAEQLIGRPRTALLGKNDYDMFPRQEADFFTRKDREVLEGKKLIEIPEETIVTATGKKTLATKKIPILDEAGTPRYLLGISEDITERKALEGFVAQSEKLASLGRLSAGIAHEINNPIAFVTNNLTVLQRDCLAILQLVDLYQAEQATLAKHTPEAAARIAALAQDIDLAYVRGNLEGLLKRTLNGLDRVTRIVKGLRGYARSTPGKRQLVFLPELFDAGLEIIQNELRQRNIAVERDYGDPPKISCVFSDINQVLLNLLVNACHAIEAMPADHAGRIRIAVRVEGEELVAEVTDNGCGIPEENRARLFDPFFTTKEVNQGTGLGLWIAHSIITAHGGRIEVDSQPGKGSRFHICLPINQPTASS